MKADEVSSEVGEEVVVVAAVDTVDPTAARAGETIPLMEQQPPMETGDDSFEQKYLAHAM